MDRREKAPAFAASPADGPGDVVVTDFGHVDVDQFHDRLDATATTVD